MNKPTGLRPADKAAVVCLLIAAAGAPLLSTGAAATAWLPAWTGAAIGLAALLGMLLVLWRAGALRMRFVVLFVGVLAAAALYGLLFAPQG